MSVRLCRWGNSVGLRLPKSLLQTAGLAAGGYVSLRVLDNGDIRVRPLVSYGTAEASISELNSPPIENGDDSWSEAW